MGDIGWLLQLVLAAVVGGLITYLVTIFTEARKRHFEKQDKFLDKKREALEAALRWIEPIELSLMRIESAIYRGQSFTSTDMSVQRGATIGDLLTHLAELDLPDHQRILLPEGAYNIGMGILQDIEELKMTAPLGLPQDERVALYKQLQVRSKKLQDLLVQNIRIHSGRLYSECATCTVSVSRLSVNMLNTYI